VSSKGERRDVVRAGEQLDEHHAGDEAADVRPEGHAVRRLVLAIVGPLVLAGLGWANQGWAWGDVGHKIVCEIAFHELNDRARAEVTRLIKQDSEFRLFSNSCVWPDHPKQREIEHYINVPRNLGRFTTDHCPGGVKCLFSAIRTDLKVLTTPGASDRAKLRSLKFLSHWIGDLHQPLHVSFADDRGGGKIRDNGVCAADLHGVWDWCIIEQTLGQRARDIARHLGTTITNVNRATWPKGQIHDWATESLVLAREASVQYCVPKGNACDYDAARPTYEPGSPERVVDVDAAYLNAQTASVIARLKRGGVRLAHLLNNAFGP
jgi:nuclease S1